MPRWHMTPNNPDEGAGCDRERVLGFPGWKNDAENPRRAQEARDREEVLKCEVIRSSWCKT